MPVSLQTSDKIFIVQKCLSTMSWASRLKVSMLTPPLLVAEPLRSITTIDNLRSRESSLQHHERVTTSRTPASDRPGGRQKLSLLSQLAGIAAHATTVYNHMLACPRIHARQAAQARSASRPNPRAPQRISQQVMSLTLLFRNSSKPAAAAQTRRDTNSPINQRDRFPPPLLRTWARAGPRSRECQLRCGDHSPVLYEKIEPGDTHKHGNITGREGAAFGSTERPQRKAGLSSATKNITKTNSFCI